MDLELIPPDDTEDVIESYVKESRAERPSPQSLIERRQEIGTGKRKIVSLTKTPASPEEAWSPFSEDMKHGFEKGGDDWDKPLYPHSSITRMEVTPHEGMVLKTLFAGDKPVAHVFHDSKSGVLIGKTFINHNPSEDIADGATAKHVTYHTNGNVNSMVYHLGDKPHGVHLFFNDKGGLQRKEVWNNGNKLDERVYKSASSVADKLGINWEKVKFTLRDLTEGMKEELEHKDITHGDEIKTAKIALAHLKEDPKYYKKLSACMKKSLFDVASKGLYKPQTLRKALWKDMERHDDDFPSHAYSKHPTPNGGGFIYYPRNGSGTYRIVTHDGMTMEEGSLLDHKPHGTINRYDENIHGKFASLAPQNIVAHVGTPGTVPTDYSGMTETITMRNGSLEGPYSIKHPERGTLIRRANDYITGNYQDNLPHGTFNVKDQYGKLIHSSNYMHGNPQESGLRGDDVTPWSRSPLRPMYPEEMKNSISIDNNSRMRKSLFNAVMDKRSGYSQIDSRTPEQKFEAQYGKRVINKAIEQKNTSTRKTDTSQVRWHESWRLK